MIREAETEYDYGYTPRYGRDITVDFETPSAACFTLLACQLSREANGRVYIASLTVLGFGVTIEVWKVNA